MRYFSTTRFLLQSEFLCAFSYCCIWFYNLHIPDWGLPVSIYVVWQQIESSLPYLRAFASRFYLIPPGRGHHVPVPFMRPPSKAQAWRACLYRYNWTYHTYSATEIMKHQLRFFVVFDQLNYSPQSQFEGKVGFEPTSTSSQLNNLFLQRKLLCAGLFFYRGRKIFKTTIGGQVFTVLSAAHRFCVKFILVPPHLEFYTLATVYIFFYFLATQDFYRLSDLNSIPPRRSAACCLLHQTNIFIIHVHQAFQYLLLDPIHQ